MKFTSIILLFSLAYKYTSPDVPNVPDDSLTYVVALSYL